MNTASDFTGQSADRFTKACSMVNKYQQMKEPGSPIDHCFTILDAVAQGTHTKWSIVYDISSKKIYFKTLGFSQVKEVSFDRFDFSCDKYSQSWDMNQPATGDVSALFKPFTLEINLNLINRSFIESKGQIEASDERIKENAGYPGLMKCE